MGGPGSGRWGNHTPKVTVEQCGILDIRLFTYSHRVLRPHFPWLCSGAFQQRCFTSDGIQEIIVITYELDTRNMNSPWLELSYRSPYPGRYVKFRIELQTTEQPKGGVRWYFGCPIPVNGSPCNQRAAQLQLPPGGDVFGCRECYNLTFRSSQTSHCGVAW